MIPLLLAFSVAAEIPLESNGTASSMLDAPPVEIQGLAPDGPIRTDVGGRLVVEGRRFAYVPPSDYAGIDSFTWRSETGIATVSFRVGHAPIAVDDRYETAGNVGLDVPPSRGLLANDLSHHGVVVELGEDGLLEATTTAGGTIVVGPHGGFSYRPALGFVGTDHVSYALANGLGTHSAVLEIEVGPSRVWFVSAGALPGGRGTPSHPLSHPSEVPAQPRDVIALGPGSYSAMGLTNEVTVTDWSSLSRWLPRDGVFPSDADRPAVDVVTVGRDTHLVGLLVGQLRGREFGRLEVEHVDILDGVDLVDGVFAGQLDWIAGDEEGCVALREARGTLSVKQLTCPGSTNTRSASTLAQRR